MKYLILTLTITFSNIALAGGFFALEKHGKLPESFKLHETKESCEQDEKSPCYDIHECPIEICELKDNEVLDYNAKENIVSCESVEDCDAKFLLQSCVKGEAIKNLDNMEIYCTYPVMKIDGKKLVESNAKKLARKAEKKAKEDTELSKKEAKQALKQKLKGIKKSDLSNNAKTVDVLMDLIELLKEE